MRCPLCKQELHVIGHRLSGQKDYDCPTKIEMTIGYSNQGTYSGWRNLVSHYEVRGSRTIINLPDDYQIVICGTLLTIIYYECKAKTMIQLLKKQETKFIVY